MQSAYLRSAIRLFTTYKQLGERAIAQVTDEDLFAQAHPDSNSIAIIVQHLWGNMRSRWTDFLDSDGEKPWRERDAEFEPVIQTRALLLERWEEGWNVLLTTLSGLQEQDLDRTVTIRTEPLTVMDAINRQLTHYAYHVGQIVFICRMRTTSWETLSVAKGGSAAFNAEKAGEQKVQRSAAQ